MTECEGGREGGSGREGGQKAGRKEGGREEERLTFSLPSSLCIIIKPAPTHLFTMVLENSGRITLVNSAVNHSSLGTKTSREKGEEGEGEKGGRREREREREEGGRIKEGAQGVP